MRAYRYYPLAIGFIAIFTISCSLIQVGDSAIKVQGSIFLDGKPIETCRLEFWLLEGHEFLYTEDISSDFEVLVFVSPQKRDYYIRILCPDSSTIFETNPFSSKGSSRYHKPVDLGKVHLLRES